MTESFTKAARKMNDADYSVALAELIVREAWRQIDHALAYED